MFQKGELFKKQYRLDYAKNIVLHGVFIRIMVNDSFEVI